MGVELTKKVNLAGDDPSSTFNYVAGGQDYKSGGINENF